MKEFIKKYDVQFIVVIISFIFLELAFSVSLGFYPFRSANLLVTDMYYEYVPFFNYVRDCILSGRNLFTSFSFSLGQSMIGILAYYCMSPFNLILLFSNLFNITYFMKVLIFIKIILCGLTMTFYLKDKTNKLNIVIFSLIYAFMSYNIRYAFNIMWLDVIYMLPLAILGVEKLIDGKSNKLYIISLTIMMFSNFYIAFGSCIFILIYFFYYSLIKKKLSWKLLFRFAYSSIIPALLSAVILIPTSYNMLDGKAISAPNDYDSLILYNPADIIYNFAPGKTAGSTLIDLPYFYSTVFILILFINYLLNKEISFKERALSFWIVFFLIFATLIAPIDLIFHCFRVPNSFLYRYIYVLPFFLISVVSRNKIKVSWFSLIPIVLLVVWAFTVEFSIKMIVFGTLLFLYFILMKAELKYLVIVVIVGELFYNTAVNIKVYSGFETYNDVYKYKEILKDYMPEENEFYRIELNEPVTINDSFMLGFYGIDSFSPTISMNTKKFLKGYLLMSELDTMNYVYQTRTVLDPYFLGVKYELVDDEVKEYNYYLPLIFKSDSFDYFEPTNLIIENSNNLYKMINGEYFFKEIPFEIDCLKDNVIIKKECNLKYEKKAGYKYYLEFYNYPKINEFIFDPLTTSRYTDRNFVLNVENSFRFDYDDIRLDDIKLYEYDESKIKTQTNEFKIFQDNYMRLEVDGGRYLMTIPYDDSWHIRVNGKEIKKIKVLDSLIGFETDGGIVEIEFIPKGLIAGMIISGITLSTIIVYLVRKRNRCGNEKNIEKI